MKCVKVWRLLQSCMDWVRWRLKQIRSSLSQSINTVLSYSLIDELNHLFSLFHHQSFISSQHCLLPFCTLSFCPNPRRMMVCGWGRVTWCHLSTPQLAWRKRRGWAPAQWPSSCCSSWWASSWASWSCRRQRSLVSRSMLSGEGKQTGSGNLDQKCHIYWVGGGTSFDSVSFM